MSKEQGYWLFHFVLFTISYFSLCYFGLLEPIVFYEGSKGAIEGIGVSVLISFVTGFVLKLNFNVFDLIP